MRQIIVVTLLYIFAFSLGALVVDYYHSNREPVKLTPHIEYGFLGIENLRELVDCELEEPITVIVSIMNYYDDYEELNLDHTAMTGDDEEVWGWTNCEWQPEHNIAMCDVYTLLPEYVQDDPVMDTMGHEQLHGSCRDFHE